MSSFFNKLEKLYSFISTRCPDKKDITIPSIVTIGSESSGKSSLLENITQREIFPRNRTRCTMFPVKIINKHRANKFASIEQGNFTYDAEDDENVKEIICNLFDKTNEIVDNPIIITICNKKLPDGLTFMDLPGLCVDCAITHTIAKKYIEGDVLILCTVPSTITRFTADQAISLLKNNNKLKNTILVLTVPDRIPSEDLDEFLIDRLNGNSDEFDKRSVILMMSVINRSLVKGNDKLSLEENRIKESEFFTNLIYDYKCDELAEQLGTDNLIKTLDYRFRQHIENTWYPIATKALDNEISRLDKLKKDVGDNLGINEFHKIYMGITDLSQFHESLKGSYPVFEMPRSFNIGPISKDSKVIEFTQLIISYIKGYISCRMDLNMIEFRLDRYPTIVAEIENHIDNIINRDLFTTHIHILDNFRDISYIHIMKGQSTEQLVKILINDIFGLFEFPNIDTTKIKEDYDNFVKIHEKKYKKEIDILAKNKLDLNELFTNKDIKEIESNKYSKKTIKNFLSNILS